MTDRASRLLQALDGGESELMLVTSLLNVRYLTGFTGSNAIAVIGPETRAFVTDFRYQEQVRSEVDDSFQTVIHTGDLLEAVDGLLPAGDVALGFEDAHLTVRQHTHLRELLPERIGLTAAGDPVEQLRAVKEPTEIAAIRAATELGDEALREILEQGLVGRTEIEVAVALEQAMRRRGASGASFDSIVAQGAHGALPHATPRDVTIDSGQLVVIDWGCVLDGYCSDCTRTIATGPIDATAQAAYDLTLEAQLAGLTAIKPGMEGKEADAIARRVIESAGHGEHFGHSLGHGVGLEVHEGPSLSKRSTATLEPGNVVTVEPGVYLPGEVGVRIEDLCVVTEDGHEILTSIAKELITVG
jgi:Xaa-Pro aminopeptidase